MVIQAQEKENREEMSKMVANIEKDLIDLQKKSPDIKVAEAAKSFDDTITRIDYDTDVNCDVVDHLVKPTLKKFDPEWETVELKYKRRQHKKDVVAFDRRKVSAYLRNAGDLIKEGDLLTVQYSSLLNMFKLVKNADGTIRISKSRRIMSTQLIRLLLDKYGDSTIYWHKDGDDIILTDSEGYRP